MKIVSACLAGIKSRYDGQANPCQKVIDLVEQGKAVPVCPEQLGGLPTPREPAEQRKGKIVTEKGQEVTKEFKRGAAEGLKIAELVNCQEAILASRSPSCGSGKIYDGTFSRKLIKGDGVFASLLKKKGIKVLTEEEV